jgi:hypothetical protein
MSVLDCGGSFCLLCAFLSRQSEVQSVDRLMGRTLGLISRSLQLISYSAHCRTPPLRQHVRRVGQNVQANLGLVNGERESFPNIYIIFTMRFLSTIARPGTADYYAPSI